MSLGAALSSILAGPLPQEGQSSVINGVDYVTQGDVLRSRKALAVDKDALADFYHKHWTLEGAYDDQFSDDYQAEIFEVMFGDHFTKVANNVPTGAYVLDIGCGSGVAGRTFFKPVLDRIHYIAVDMSGSIDQAKREFEQRHIQADYVQADISSLPFRKEAVDYVFCPGVLHYTDSIADSVCSLAQHLKKGGRFITWMYKEQKPIRRFTDDMLRAYFTAMSPEEAFEAMKPLTKLGIALGEAGAKITVPEDVPVLEIEKGEYDLQRFIYYHVLKLFYHPNLSFTRHNVNNWNAYYPGGVLFPPLKLIREAFTSNGFTIDYFNPGGNGVSVVATKL